MKNMLNHFTIITVNLAVIKFKQVTNLDYILFKVYTKIQRMLLLSIDADT